MLPSPRLRRPPGVHAGLCAVQRLHGGLRQPAASGLRPGRPETRHPLPLLPPAGLSPVTQSARQRRSFQIYLFKALTNVCVGEGGRGLRLERQKTKRRTRSCSAAWSLSLKTASSLLWFCLMASAGGFHSTVSAKYFICKMKGMKRCATLPKNCPCSTALLARQNTREPYDLAFGLWAALVHLSLVP